MIYGSFQCVARLVAVKTDRLPFSSGGTASITGPARRYIGKSEVVGTASFQPRTAVTLVQAQMSSGNANIQLYTAGYETPAQPDSLARSGQENQSRGVRRIGSTRDRAAPASTGHHADGEQRAGSEQGDALDRRRLHDLANPGVPGSRYFLNS
jgi:hypothetical protein